MGFFPLSLLQMDSKHLSLMTSQPRRAVRRCIQPSQLLVWHDRWLWCVKTARCITALVPFQPQSCQVATLDPSCETETEMLSNYTILINRQVCLKSYFIFKIVVLSKFQVNLKYNVVYTVCFAQTERARGGPVCLAHYWSVFSSEFISGCD